MAGKPSKPSLQAAAFLKKNPLPNITAQGLADKFGLSRSSVTGSAYWKEYRKAVEKSNQGAA